MRTVLINKVGSTTLVIMGDLSKGADAKTDVHYINKPCNFYVNSTGYIIVDIGFPQIKFKYDEVFEPGDSYDIQSYAMYMATQGFFSGNESISLTPPNGGGGGIIVEP